MDYNWEEDLIVIFQVLSSNQNQILLEYFKSDLNINNSDNKNILPN